MDDQRSIAIADLAEAQTTYIEGEGYERHPTPEYFAIEYAIKDMEKLDKIETIVKSVMLTEDCYNAIVKIKDVLGLSK